MALGLFKDHGFAATSMEMIAGAAKVTRPVVYACYPNKLSLFRALLDREERRLLAQIMLQLPRRPDLDAPKQTLIEGFTGILTAASVAPDSWGVIFLSEHGSDEVAARVERGRRQIRERLSGLAAPVLASRGIDDPDGRLAELTAHLLVGNAEAGARLMLSSPEEWPPQELGSYLGRMVAPALEVLEEISAERAQ